MTPTPSHVATDELIETLERRRTKSMAFEREFGLEGRTICPDDLDALFVTLSISEASALISALKENQRMREALSELLIPVKFAGETIWGPPEDRFPGYEARIPSEFVRKAEAALQPQGEK